MSIFDDMAQTWDDKPDRIERTKVVAARLRDILDFDGVEAGLEYGCGTGQLSFALADVIPHCLLVDTSLEMLKAAERGIAQRALPWDTEWRNFAAQATDHPEAIADVLYGMQVLHHVDDLETTLANMHKALKPDGQLALMDLPAGSAGFHRGTQHDPDENPHLHGLDRGELEDLLTKVGFLDITWHADIELERDDDEGRESYSLFLVTAHV